MKKTEKKQMEKIQKDIINLSKNQKKLAEGINKFWGDMINHHKAMNNILKTIMSNQCRIIDFHQGKKVKMKYIPKEDN